MNDTGTHAPCGMKSRPESVAADPDGGVIDEPARMAAAISPVTGVGVQAGFVVVVVVFLVVNFVLTSLVQPYYVGDAVDLSISVVLISLVFWAWLIGPIGAVLAVPLTLFVKCLLIDADPRASWATALIGAGGSAPRPSRPEAPATHDEPGEPDELGEPSGDR